jgi:hypothetical protein
VRVSVSPKRRSEPLSAEAAWRDFRARLLGFIARRVGDRESAEDILQDVYLQPVPDGVWEPKVTVRSTRWARMYAPGEFIERVSPTPLLMLVADHDHTAVTDLALKAFERALEPKPLVMIRGGHFDPYLGGFETASRAAVDWFKRHL